MQMQNKSLAQRVERARELLAEIPHVAIATVNADGSPHISPVFMAFDERLNGFWSSSPDSKHSQNIARTGQVMLVIFDGREGHGGLFIEASAAALETSADAEHGLRLLSARKESHDGNLGHMGELSDYIGNGLQRVYQATPKRFWVNVSDHDAAGMITRDRRYEIKSTDLVQNRL